MQLLEELLVTIFQMRFRNFLLSLLGTLEKTLQKLALFQEILNASQEHLAMEWLGNIGVGSMFVTFCTMLLKILCREHNDWNMRSSRMGFQLFCKHQTVHHRHHYIANHQIGHFPLGNFQSLLAIGSLQNNVGILQKGMLILADVVIIINNQDGWLVGILANQLLDFSTFSFAIIYILQYRLIYRTVAI